MTRLSRRIRRFLRRDQGSATIEFVILFPVFMVLFVSSFELGNIMLRQTMLDRSIDMTVRQIRIGAVGVVDHDTIKEMICERSYFLDDCDRQLKLEMQVVDPRAWVNLDPDIDCIDQADYGIPPRRFDSGSDNQMMILRACHLFEPMVSDFGLGTVLGELMARESGNAYRLTAVASYVVEPGGAS
jgi:hypothetical protein